MQSRIKAVGLALVVSVAVSAAAAPHSYGDFTSGTPHTSINGQQVSVHEFSAGSGFGAVTCKGAKFTGTTVASSEDDIVVYPSYELCLDSFGRHVHVSGNVGLILTSPSSHTAATSWHLVGTLTYDVTNSGGSVVCTAKVTSQTFNNVVYHNIANGDVEMVTSTTNVTATTSGGFLNCGISNGHHTGGTYVGMTVIAGTDTGSSNVNIAIDPD